MRNFASVGKIYHLQITNQKRAFDQFLYDFSLLFFLIFLIIQANFTYDDGWQMPALFFMKEEYADVIIPLPLEGTFTYRIPAQLHKEIEVGVRVIVQFGVKRFYSAIVSKIHENIPSGHEIKDIQSVVDERPILFPENIQLWRWISEYYCCSMGEVMKAALPSAMKLESQTKVLRIAHEQDIVLPETEEIIFQNLSEQAKPLLQLKKEVGAQFSFKALNSLLEKQLISVEEKVSAKYKQKTEEFISLSPKISSEQKLHEALDGLKNAKKQKELLLHFSEITKVFSPDELKKISKKELLSGTSFSAAMVKGLVGKKILYSSFIPVSRIEHSHTIQGGLNLLNPFQEEALQKIKKEFENQQVVLLHGVTSSGKTEIYSHLIEEKIKDGQQVLYLVPEISLTTQIIQRLNRTFGKKVGIYHSKLNDQERVEIWNKVLAFENDPENSYQVILGARSSIFLPFCNLGLIIVDEEHENSYKQFDPAPRYNARDMAVVMGYQNKAKVLLGTATPSFESFYNARTKKFGFVELNQRHRKMEMPEINIADVQWAFKRKQIKSFLTPLLYEEIEKALENKEQIILFQNRRGYSPFVECMQCGWIPKCTKCDVSLTYHKYKKQLNCHYCGYYIQMPATCHDCGAPDIKTRGMGTEKIETELKEIFPNARVGRMDFDSTRGKTSFERIINKLENKKIDVLVGTQMVTKGLDFDHVSIVGVLNADNMLNFPDFRAHERSFQLISQVSGRAGRNHKRGKVIIQTSNPEHQIIKEIQRNAYSETFERQLNERKLFKYPPFYRMVKIIVKHKNKDSVSVVSMQLATKLRNNNRLIVLGPEFPVISRIKLWHHKEIWVKFSKSNDLGELKKYITDSVQSVKHLPGNSGTAFNIDVDPI